MSLREWINRNHPRPTSTCPAVRAGCEVVIEVRLPSRAVPFQEPSLLSYTWAWRPLSSPCTLSS